MKRITLAFALVLFLNLYTTAQKMSIENRISQIEDRIAIKNVVDTFSILADTKETQKQTLLFTENAVVESTVNGQSGAPLTGRKQIGDTFAAFLATFETVYHLNGQQSIALNGDKASAISYCQVTLIGNQNGKKMKTTFGVRYNDDFVRENGKWLIAKRKSTFMWTETLPLAQ